MGITRHRNHFYFVMRVPRRFAHIDPRAQVRRALFTDSEREAHSKEPAIRAEFLTYWKALAAGEHGDAATAFDAAKKLAAARGFRYRPAADLAADASLEEVLTRLEALIRPDGSYAPLVEGIALLGGIEPPATKITEALREMMEFSAIDRLAKFSDDQRKRWRQPRETAVADFVAVIGEDRPILEITRADAQAFRKWLDGRITGPGKLTRNTANKKIGFLSDLFSTWTEYHAIKAESPFAKLRFRDDQRRTKRLPFSADWIRQRLLAPGALDRMNEEARDVLLVMVNTGARPNEIIGAGLADFAVDAEIPYLDIRENENRAVKTETSPRQIPLVGVSLDAARRIVARGGVARYVGKSDSWSAAVGKYLRENGLRETPQHSAYCLRHSFEDRMTEAGVDDRIRAELMGHKYHRPDYGRGGSMEKRAKVLRPISF
ncbi:tyrosine-type recombinase/integrase [Paracoccus aurantiacus]|nr:tyrosine-type recombinase/integrase [Paracoccus aurantiacus]